MFTLKISKSINALRYNDNKNNKDPFNKRFLITLFKYFGNTCE